MINARRLRINNSESELPNTRHKTKTKTELMRKAFVLSSNQKQTQSFHPVRFRLGHLLALTFDCLLATHLFSIITSADTYCVTAQQFSVANFRVYLRELCTQFRRRSCTPTHLF